MKIIYFILFTSFCFLSKAQEVSSSGGEDFISQNYQVSWTLGEPVTETCSSANCIITQGEQQPKLILTSIQEDLRASITINAYPNPVKDYINIHAENSGDEDISYYLYGLDSRIITSGKLNGNNTRIKMSHYVPSTYILKVTYKNKALRTFKIMKNQ